MKKNRLKVFIILFLLLLTTGCTKTLTDKNNKAVKNEKTGQTLTENILCKPTNSNTLKIYKENKKVDLDKLPDCSDFTVKVEKKDGIWTVIFVKPLAYILLKIGKFVKNYGLSVIIVSLLIRLIAFPLTKKTAMQSEVMKKAQPELNRIQKKYADKKDQESVMKQNQEMMAVYKKYGINPMAGCLFAFIQLPIFIAFFEALQRTPVIFEDWFLGLQLGTTPMVGISSATFYSYIILMIIIAISTFFSFKMNGAMASDDPNMKMMPLMMSGMIVITAVFMPTGLGIYWVTSNLFTIAQNALMKRSKDKHGKA